MKTTTLIHWNEGTISKPHNEREEELCSNESHIDLYNEHGYSFHDVIFDKDLRDVYIENVGNAIEEYNLKQKRKDRKTNVDAYIKSVEEDTRGKKQTKKKNGKRVVNENAPREGKQTSYEFTVRVGNTCKKKDKNNRVMYDENNHHIHEEELPRELQCICLNRYYDEFEENNPNFKLVSVNRHGDEGFYNRRGVWEYGEIHDHIEFVPFATGCFKQGLSVQNSMNKAMAAMGFNNANCYSEWAKKEQKRLDKIVQEEYVKYCENHPDFAKEHGDLTIYHPITEKTNSGDKTKEQYVAEQELDELIGEAEHWKRNYRKLSKDVKKKQEQLNEKAKVLNEKEKQHIYDKQREADRKKQLDEREHELNIFAEKLNDTCENMLILQETLDKRAEEQEAQEKEFQGKEDRLDALKRATEDERRRNEQDKKKFEQYKKQFEQDKQDKLQKIENIYAKMDEIYKSMKMDKFSNAKYLERCKERMDQAGELVGETKDLVKKIPDRSL